MGFLDALRQQLAADRQDAGDRVASALVVGSLDDTAHPEYPGGQGVPADPTALAQPPRTTEYDRDQWRRKLKRVLERLPTSAPEWPSVLSDAGALNLETAEVERCQREEFALLVRQAVADRVVTLAEHSRLEQARMLIGLNDADAEAILQAVVADAEAFFGKPVAGIKDH